MLDGTRKMVRVIEVRVIQSLLLFNSLYKNILTKIVEEEGENTDILRLFRSLTCTVRKDFPSVSLGREAKSIRDQYLVYHLKILS